MMLDKKTIKILLVEDDEDDFILFKEYIEDIKNVNYELSWSSNFDDAVNLIAKKEHHVYVFDYLLGKYTGIDLLKRCAEFDLQAPIILLTGVRNQATDITAVQLGAADYLVKGEISSITLERSLRHGLEQASVLQELKTSENKFRSIFENSHDVIYIATQDGRLIDINTSAVRLFGYNKDTLLTMNAVDFYEDKNDRSAFMEALYKTGIVSNYEVTLKDKDGNKKYCIITASTQKEGEDKETYHQGIIRDITRRKKTEQDLMIAEKLAVTGQVARTLAHEVRNPLTNIYLAMEQLKEETKKEDSLSPYLDIIKRNSDRINNIIRELLQHSNISQVKISRHLVNDIMNETILLAQDRAILKNIKIQTEFTEIPCRIMADSEKLKIALTNILVNAIEAVEEQKGLINIGTFFNDNKVSIKIEDNGPGISQENISRIFEPYYTQKPNGMGLGLATSLNIIKSLDGYIDIASEMGIGTKFTIHLNC